MEKKSTHCEIGFIGLGVMGKPMACNLIHNGYKVNFFARKKNIINFISRKGGNFVNSIGELAKKNKIIFLNLTDDNAINDVILSTNNVADNLKQGSIIVDFSTISPSKAIAVSKILKKKKSYFLDCPVSGGEIGAIKGNLSIMVGGELRIYKKILHLLKCIGENITYIGESGSGQVAKVCNQIVVAQTISAISEIFVLAKKTKTSQKKIREALLGGFAFSKILEIHGEKIIKQNFKPGFKTHLHLKDLKIAVNLAKRYGLSLRGAEYSKKLLQKAVRNNLQDEDSASMSKIVEKMSK
tara:strand:+ start:224 stop:1114 length:891 start_codon:yes stop_codon:yes gene_type:complete